MQTSLMLVAPAKDPAKLSEPIFCEGHAVGQIEVRLNQKCPDVDGGVGPFLAEEKVLLHDICRKVSEFLTSLNRTDALIERKKVRIYFLFLPL